ncbi:MAG: choice-of-anchor Q domain-containing protein [Lentimicrobium sp.]|jgi:predicted outer membrane repeat protein|nr:choice-of-anchor Q domain-containing protein [Lentimicrobium sp.]
MKRLILSLLFTCLLKSWFAGFAMSQTIYIQGEQTGTLEADTIFLAGDVTIPQNGTLTFLPGSRIIATGFYGFDVAGTVLALGIEGNSIEFTVSDTAGFSNPENGRGGWDGFNFRNTNPWADSSLFSHCIFSYGKAIGDSLAKMGGAFNIRQFDRIRFSDCDFINNQAYVWGGAVFADSCNILMKDCNFIGNFCGSPVPLSGYGGAVCLRNSVADILRCSFIQNSSTGIGGAVALEYADVLLQSSVFKDNSSGLGGALGYLRSTPVRPVAGNLFTGNTAVYFGGAISFNRANPLCINNTITENSSDSYGGGVYCNDSAAPVLINNIIYGNHAFSGTQVYIWDVSSAPEFYFCNVEGGPAAFGGTGGIGFVSPYLNNIDTIPGFSGLHPHPYSLNNDSPCINAGNPDTTGMMLPVNDLAGNPRLTGTRIDVGAYESLAGITGVNSSSLDFSFKCYPNPFNEEIVFTFPEEMNDPFNIRIIDFWGKEVLNVRGISSNKLIWRMEHYHKSGIYHVIVSSGNYRAVSTIVSIR